MSESRAGRGGCRRKPGNPDTVGGGKCPGLRSRSPESGAGQKPGQEIDTRNGRHTSDQNTKGHRRGDEDERQLQLRVSPSDINTACEDAV